MLTDELPEEGLFEGECGWDITGTIPEAYGYVLSWKRRRKRRQERRYAALAVPLDQRDDPAVRATCLARLRGARQLDLESIDG